MVRKFQWRGPSAAFCTINHHEVRVDARFLHGLDDAKPFPWVTNAQLETHRFALAEGTQFLYKLHQTHRGGEAAVGRRRHTVFTHLDATRLGNFFSDFGAWQHTAVSRFGTLAEFDLHHLDLGRAHVVDKVLWAEVALFVAAAKITRANFPNQVAAMHAVVTRDRALAGVVCKATQLRALVQGHDRIGTEGAKAHGRDVEQADAVGLGAACAPYLDTKVMAGELRWGNRVVDPLVADRTHIELRAKWAFVRGVLGACVNQATLRSGERGGFGFGL